MSSILTSIIKTAVTNLDVEGGQVMNDAIRSSGSDLVIQIEWSKWKKKGAWPKRTGGDDSPNIHTHTTIKRMKAKKKSGLTITGLDRSHRVLANNDLKGGFPPHSLVYPPVIGSYHR